MVKRCDIPALCNFANISARPSHKSAAFAYNGPQECLLPSCPQYHGQAGTSRDLGSLTVSWKAPLVMGKHQTYKSN